MKTARKLFAMLMALSMILALAVTANAAGNYDATKNDASITVSNAKANQTYTIYKLFDASVDPDRTDGATGINYTLMAGKTLENNTWFRVDERGNVLSTGVAISDVAEDGSGATAAGAANRDAFRAWAESYGVEGETITAREDAPITFANLTYGYYYITTSSGSLVTVDSVKPDETVIDKNPAPGLDKNITNVKSHEADAVADAIYDEGKSATAQMGDTITYTVEIKARPGAENLTFKDVLSDGLTLLPATIKVDNDALADSTIVKAGYTAEVKTGTDPDIVIAFTKAYLDGIGQETTITITYDAIVNDSAVIGVEGNPNSATLDYGHDPQNLTTTEPVEAKVYTGKITVDKFDGATEEKLDGVQFVLYKMSGNDKLYYKVSTDAVNNAKVVTWVAGEANATTLTTANGGVIVVEGLTEGTYFWHETKALDGYNLILSENDPTFVIEDNGEIAAEGDTAAVAAHANLVKTSPIENNKGAELPSTGGIGTTIFTVVGATLMIGAAVLFVTKKRSIID